MQINELSNDFQNLILFCCKEFVSLDRFHLAVVSVNLMSVPNIQSLHFFRQQQSFRNLCRYLQTSSPVYISIFSFDFTSFLVYITSLKRSINTISRISRWCYFLLWLREQFSSLIVTKFSLRYYLNSFKILLSILVINIF